MTLRSSDLQSHSDLDSIRNSCDVYLQIVCYIGKVRGLCVYKLTNQPTSHLPCQLSPLLFLRKHFHLAFVLRRRLPGTETTPSFLPQQITCLLMPIMLKLPQTHFTAVLLIFYQIWREVICINI